MKKSTASKMKDAVIEHPSSYVKRLVHRSERRKGKADIRKQSAEVETPKSKSLDELEVKCL